MLLHCFSAALPMLQAAQVLPRSPCLPQWSACSRPMTRASLRCSPSWPPALRSLSRCRRSWQQRSGRWPAVRVRPAGWLGCWVPGLTWTGWRATSWLLRQTTSSSASTSRCAPGSMGHHGCWHHTMQHHAIVQRLGAAVLQLLACNQTQPASGISQVSFGQTHCAHSSLPPLWHCFTL